MVNLKDKIEERGKSAIYKIPREGCDKCYIRQTRKKIGVRFKEHLKTIKNRKLRNHHIMEHLLTYNRTIKSIKCIKHVNNYKYLDIREAMEMFKNKN